jgi:ABC-type sugar transport system substrate-binding protein
VGYLVLSEASALGPGLTGALQAAGLGPDKVKIIGEGGNATTWQEIAQGKVEAVLPPALHSYDYGMLDALARHFAGAKVQNTPPDLWLVDKDNIPKTNAPAFSPVEDYQAQWSELWGKSS